MLAQHYAEHVGKPFYQPLVEFMSSGPVVAVVAEGQRVIEGFRALAGATDPTVALPGTIRGDLGRDWGLKVQQNLVHGSDSPDSAAREIGLWFGDLPRRGNRLVSRPVLWPVLGLRGCAGAQSAVRGRGVQHGAAHGDYFPSRSRASRDGQ